MNLKLDTGAWLIIVLTLIAALAFGLLIGATPAVAKSGSLGATYTHVVDDVAGGLTGTYQQHGKHFDFDIDADLNIGDIYKGAAHLELTKPLGTIGAKLILDSTYKGYTLETLGYTLTTTLAGTVSIQSLNIDIGVGGRNAAPWGAPTLLTDAVPLGYNEATLVALGASKITPDPKGLPFATGTALLLLAQTGLDINRWNIDVRGALDLTGQEKLHTLLTSAKTNAVLFSGIAATLNLQLGLAFYQEQIHYETATLLGLAYIF